jgi:hypothetical protein
MTSSQLNTLLCALPLQTTMEAMEAMEATLTGKRHAEDAKEQDVPKKRHKAGSGDSDPTSNAMEDVKDASASGGGAGGGGKGGDDVFRILTKEELQAKWDDMKQSAKNLTAMEGKHKETVGAVVQAQIISAASNAGSNGFVQLLSTLEEKTLLAIKGIELAKEEMEAKFKAARQSAKDMFAAEVKAATDSSQKKKKKKNKRCEESLMMDFVTKTEDLCHEMALADAKTAVETAHTLECCGCKRNAKSKNGTISLGVLMMTAMDFRTKSLTWSEDVESQQYQFEGDRDDFISPQIIVPSVCESCLSIVLSHLINLSRSKRSFTLSLSSILEGLDEDVCEEVRKVLNVDDGRDTMQVDSEENSDGDDD